METADSELADYLASGSLLTEGSVSWGDMPLKISVYLTAALPPGQYVSSVRAIVFRDDDVLVVRGERGQFYILPGGRREKNESPEETLRRELLEETGWALKELSILGFMHFRHLGPKPADYPYPYPDFLWLIYTAQADNYISDAIEVDEYVRGVEFHSTDELQKLDIEKGELALFEAAIALRRSP